MDEKRQGERRTRAYSATLSGDDSGAYDLTHDGRVVGTILFYEDADIIIKGLRELESAQAELESYREHSRKVGGLLAEARGELNIARGKLMVAESTQGPEGEARRAKYDETLGDALRELEALRAELARMREERDGIVLGSAVLQAHAAGTLRLNIIVDDTLEPDVIVLEDGKTKVRLTGITRECIEAIAADRVAQPGPRHRPCTKCMGTRTVCLFDVMASCPRCDGTGIEP